MSQNFMKLGLLVTSKNVNRQTDKVHVLVTSSSPFWSKSGNYVKTIRLLMISWWKEHLHSERGVLSFLGISVCESGSLQVILFNLGSSFFGYGYFGTLSCYRSQILLRNVIFGLRSPENLRSNFCQFSSHLENITTLMIINIFIAFISLFFSNY